MSTNIKDNIIFSILGVIFNTIVPILIFPYISRIFGVELIGKLNFFSSAQLYTALIVSFGVGLYGVKEAGKYRNDKLSLSRLYKELVSINLAILAVITLFIIYISLFTEFRQDATIIWTFYILLITGVVGPDWIYIGLERQKFLLLRNIVFKFLSVVSIFLFVKSEDDFYTYISILVLGISLPSILNFILINKNISKIHISPKDLTKHLKPLLAIFSIEILLRFMGLGDILILGTICGDESLGYYTMGQKITTLSISVLNITATALLPRSSFYTNNNQEENFIKLIRKTLQMLLIISIPIATNLLLQAEEIILLMGGSEFLVSTPILKGLSISVILYPIINMIVFQVLLPKSKTKFILIIYSLAVTLSITLNILLCHKFGYYGTMYSYLTVTTILFLTFISLNKVTLFYSFISKELLKSISSGVIALLSIVILRVCKIELNFIIEVIIYAIIYISSLLLFRDSLALVIINKYIKLNR